MTDSTNYGDTSFCGKLYRKGHPLALYNSALELAQSNTYSIPLNWSDFLPRGIVQELLFSLMNVVQTRSPKDSDLAIQELTTLMETQVDHISGGLDAYNSYVRASVTTASLLQLEAIVREAESRCVAAADLVELEDRDTSPNLLYMLRKSMHALNVMGKWVHAFVLVFSTNENGKMRPETKWTPWEQEKLVTLNQ
jgi:hypothetical protein